MKNYVGLYYRLMERILLICVENRESKLSEDSSKWTARFTAILDHVSSIVGHVNYKTWARDPHRGWQKLLCNLYGASCRTYQSKMGTIGTNVGMRTLLYKKGIAKFCNAPTC